MNSTSEVTCALAVNMKFVGNSHNKWVNGRVCKYTFFWRCLKKKREKKYMNKKYIKWNPGTWRSDDWKLKKLLRVLQTCFHWCWQLVPQQYLSKILRERKKKKTVKNIVIKNNIQCYISELYLYSNFYCFEHSNPVFLKSFFTLNGSNFATFNCITNCC